jgi:heme-degrading monooxygenase HmoA
MIARIWHGMVAAHVADEYHQYLLETGVPDYRQTPGNRGVYLLRRMERDLAHFQIITLWDGLDAVRAFAGDDVERARYYPGDDAFVLRKELYVEHYDVLSIDAASLDTGGR